MSLEDADRERGLRRPPAVPAVSVILPTYNRNRWLEIAVDSVLAQTFTDWELIVADDGSDETTKAYLRGLEPRPNVRVLWLTHSGNPSRVRNAALRGARGKYVAFLDSDDTWSPRKLEAQLAALQSAPACRWSYTSCDRIDADGDLLPSALQPTTPVRDGFIFEPLLAHEAWAAMPTVVAERTLVEEIGGFDEEQLYGEFHDLCLRLAMRSEVRALPGVFCSVRNHDDHYSANRVAALFAWMRLYERFCVLAPTARGRACSARLRARAALDLAALLAAREDFRSVWRTLRAGQVLSWRHPGLWHRWALALLRPLAPRKRGFTREPPAQKRGTAA
jgi:glycosyltransferase involved in cell wall biosynthesis